MYILILKIAGQSTANKFASNMKNINTIFYLSDMCDLLLLTLNFYFKEVKGLIKFRSSS